MVTERQDSQLKGQDFTAALAAALEALERNLAVINGMNVFPVPDGDTGTNMFLTVKATWEAVAQVQADSAGGVLAAMARGSLLGARGNSGVILSQFFGGLSQGATEQAEVGAQGLALALQKATEAAYRAVGNPREGTMLTVIRRAAEAAQQEASRPGATVLTVLHAACREAQVALEQTPELLAVLKQAGVVDAGGQGMVVILEAFRRSVADEEPVGVLQGVHMPLATPAVREEFLSATEEDIYGYCTQFLIQGQDLAVDTIREDMARLASSAAVVGDQQTVRVHVHAVDPGPVISYAAARGTLSQVRMDNMDEQHQEFLVSHRSERRPLAVVAVSWGQGFAQVFRQLGAEVTECGQTMNVSVQELLEAVRCQEAEEVIILPNNPNVVLAARQAAQASERPLRVVEARSLPQGVAALLAYSPERGADENVEAMAQALDSVRTGEITRAVRDTEMDGVRCKAGQVIALLDGRLVACDDQEHQALRALLSLANLEPGSLVTLYYGLGVSPQEAQETARRITEEFAGSQAEVVYGGQPLYSYILALE